MSLYFLQNLCKACDGFGAMKSKQTLNVLPQLICCSVTLLRYSTGVEGAGLVP